METISAIREMVKDSGLSKFSISRKMGRSQNFIASTICTHNDVMTGTLVEIAHACGYRLALVSKTGRVIELGNAQQNRR